MWLLAQTLPGSVRRVMAALLVTAAQETIRLRAIHAAIDTKDALRARGCR